MPIMPHRCNIAQHRRRSIQQQYIHLSPNTLAHPRIPSPPWARCLLRCKRSLGGQSQRPLWLATAVARGPVARDPCGSWALALILLSRRARSFSPHLPLIELIAAFSRIQNCGAESSSKTIAQVLDW
jgi:hypothetical protein